MINTRNRMLTLRLSEKEYETYRAACSAAGVRCLSELARAGMQRLVSVPNGSPHSLPVGDELRELRDRVEMLFGEVHRIREKLESVADIAPASRR